MIMPNQNDPTQNPNPVSPPVDQPISPVVPPTIFPQSDLPPLPPAFQDLPASNVTTTTTTTTNDQPPRAVVVETSEPTVSQDPTDDSTGSSAPPDISSVISKPKKKFGGGKIIATILGLFVLIGGVGAGILLTQQKQLVNQKAQAGCYDACTTEGETMCVTGASSSWVAKCVPQITPGCTSPLGWKFDHPVGSCNAPPTGQPNNCGAQNCDSTQECCTAGCYPLGSNCGTGGTTKCSNSQFSGGPTGGMDGCYNQYPGYEYCSTEPGSTGGPTKRRCYFAPLPGAPLNCYNENLGNCDNPCLPRPSEPNYTPPPSCGGGTPTPTPTPTPTVLPTAPSCIPVKAYNSGWTALTMTQLSALTAGDVVNFCVGGSAATGTFDKAQFMINTTLKPETIIPRPSSSDFCQSYTILSTDTTISVKAKIHHSTGVWVGEAI